MRFASELVWREIRIIEANFWFQIQFALEQVGLAFSAWISV